MKMVNKEESILWTAHPRTKSSALYPDMYKDKDYFSATGLSESLGVASGRFVAEANVRDALFRSQRRHEQLGSEA